MGNRLSVKRTLLHTVVATLVLAAVVGIYVFVFGRFGKTEAKILVTTLTISYFSMTSLACAAAHEKKQYPLLAVSGLAMGIVGFLLFIPSIWAEWFESNTVIKAMGITGLLSFSFAQACVLSLATLQRHQRWLFYAAVVSILGLAAIISGLIIFEPHGDWIVRVVGVVGILDGCFSLCVPILHRLGGKQAAPTMAEVYEQVELVCPRCGQRGIYSLGRIECRQCSLAITVQVEASSSQAAQRGATTVNH